MQQWEHCSLMLPSNVPCPFYLVSHEHNQIGLLIPIRTEYIINDILQSTVCLKNKHHRLHFERDPAQCNGKYEKKYIIYFISITIF